jgi:hypothetical protein
LGVRVGERATELAVERKKARAATTGTNILVLKDQIIKKEMAGLSLRQPRSTSTASMDGGAFLAGQAAGSRVGMGRPDGEGSRAQSLR